MPETAPDVPGDNRPSYKAERTALVLKVVLQILAVIHAVVLGSGSGSGC
ncbi:hypothetical protein [Kitasatospora aureofaciens]|nr:hypothetical protein [Kitasatospora aureofaciens]